MIYFVQDPPRYRKLQVVGIYETGLEEFDENTDYFPEKVSPEYAQGFTVEYHPNYKVITVKQPWEEAAVDLTYIFVQCGTPAPTNYPEATVVEIPPQRVLAMSTTYLPHIEKLDKLETLVGVTDRRLIYNETIREKIEAGVIQEVGDLQTDAEKVLNLQRQTSFFYLWNWRLFLCQIQSGYFWDV